jgi:hypothetical protein
VIELDKKMLILTMISYKKKCLGHFWGKTNLSSENIKQYLSTDNFSVNNRHVVIKSSQTTQFCITKVIYKHFSCHHHIKKHFLQQIVLKLTISDSVQSHD